MVQTNDRYAGGGFYLNRRLEVICRHDVRLCNCTTFFKIRCQHHMSVLEMSEGSTLKAPLRR